MLDLTLVALAGGLGAVLRHALTSRPDPVRATAALNVAGAGLLGVAQVALQGSALLVLGGGLLGATTTFSAWMVQSDRSDRRWTVVVLPLALGLVAAVSGRMLATTFGVGS